MSLPPGFRRELWHRPPTVRTLIIYRLRTEGSSHVTEIDSAHRRRIRRGVAQTHAFSVYPAARKANGARVACGRRPRCADGAAPAESGRTGEGSGEREFEGWGARELDHARHR